MALEKNITTFVPILRASLIMQILSSNFSTVSKRKTRWELAEGLCNAQLAWYVTPERHYFQSLRACIYSKVTV